MTGLIGGERMLIRTLAVSGNAWDAMRAFTDARTPATADESGCEHARCSGHRRQRGAPAAQSVRHSGGEDRSRKDYLSGRGQTMVYVA